MKLRLSFLFLLSYLGSFAQSEVDSKLFWNSYSLVNPANSGVNSKQFATVQYRDQWVNMKDDRLMYQQRPKSFKAIYDRKVERLHGGVGLSYMHREDGQYAIEEPWFGSSENIIYYPMALFSSDILVLNYNYQWALKKERTISLGASVAYSHTKSQYYSSIWKSNILPAFDAAIPMDEVTSDVITFGGGIVYSARNFMFGFGTTNYNRGYYVPWSSSYPLYQRYHLLISQKFNVLKNSAKLTINPSILMEDYFENGSYQDQYITGNLRLIFFDLYWIGYSLKGDDTQTYMMGFRAFEKFELLYAFDPKGDHNTFNEKFGPSHEIALSFTIGKDKAINTTE